MITKEPLLTHPTSPKLLNIKSFFLLLLIMPRTISPYLYHHQNLVTKGINLQTHQQNNSPSQIIFMSTTITSSSLTQYIFMHYTWSQNQSMNQAQYLSSLSFQLQHNLHFQSIHPYSSLNIITLHHIQIYKSKNTYHASR